MKFYSIPKISLINNGITEDEVVYIDRQQAKIIFDKYRIYKKKDDDNYVPVRYNYVITLPYKDHFIHTKDKFVFSNLIPKEDTCVYTGLSKDFENRFGKYNWKFDKTRLFLRFVRLENGVLNVYFIYYITGNEQIDDEFEYDISTLEEVKNKFSKDYIDLMIGVM